MAAHFLSVTKKFEYRNLAEYWPEQTLLPKKATSGGEKVYWIGEYDQNFKGFPVCYTPIRPKKSKATGSRRRVYVPPVYKNALRFLNFKCACYVEALHSAWPKDYGLDTDDGKNLSRIRDSMRRHLAHHGQVREAFFTELEQDYYEGGDGRDAEPAFVMAPSVRSSILDSWLANEFTYQTHHPDSFNNNKRKIKDPIGLGMKLHSTFL